MLTFGEIEVGHYYVVGGEYVYTRGIHRHGDTVFLEIFGRLPSASEWEGPSVVSGKTDSVYAREKTSMGWIEGPPFQKKNLSYLVERTTGEGPRALCYTCVLHPGEMMHPGDRRVKG